MAVEDTMYGNPMWTELFAQGVLGATKFKKSCFYLLLEFWLEFCASFSVEVRRARLCEIVAGPTRLIASRIFQVWPGVTRTTHPGKSLFHEICNAHPH